MQFWFISQLMVHGLTIFLAMDLKVSVLRDSTHWRQSSYGTRHTDVFHRAPGCSLVYTFTCKAIYIYSLPPFFRPIYLRKVYAKHLELTSSFTFELFSERHLERRRASVGRPLFLSFFSLLCTERVRTNSWCLSRWLRQSMRRVEKNMNIQLRQSDTTLGSRTLPKF